MDWTYAGPTLIFVAVASTTHRRAALSAAVAGLVAGVAALFWPGGLLVPTLAMVAAETVAASVAGGGRFFRALAAAALSHAILQVVAGAPLDPVALLPHVFLGASASALGAGAPG